LTFVLRNAAGQVIPGGSVTVDVAAQQHLVGFVKDFFPFVSLTSFTGKMTVENRPPTGNGQISAIALQFDSTLSPVTVTPLP